MTELAQGLLLVGPGIMGREYARVLQALKLPFKVIGRSEATCREFTEITGIHAESKGLESLSGKTLAQFSKAIVATNTEHMAAHAIFLMQGGIRNILLEKPGGLNQQEIREVHKTATLTNSRVALAYNRRFYASVLELHKNIIDDGGLKSIFFDFTEWPSTVESLSYPPEVKQNWIFRNSSHVIDLAFHIAGKPVEFSAYSGGHLEWHPKSIFTGAGITDKNIFFSYHANWESAGRWRLEIHTKKNKWILSPLEKLHYIPVGSTQIAQRAIADEYDHQFKPGLYRMISAWVEGNTAGFSHIDEQVLLSDIIYNKILDS